MRAAATVVMTMAVVSGGFAAQPPQMNRGVLFLVGCWQWTAPDRVVDEHWMAPRGDTMLGVSRTVSQGKLISYELVVIHQYEDSMVYEAHPSGQKSAQFRSVPGIGNSRIVFENRQHDFPQRVGYELKDPNSMLAWIDGTQDGKSRRLEFPYIRVPCDK